MQRMSKDNTPIIPNPTEKVKPFCKKTAVGPYRKGSAAVFALFDRCFQV